MYIYVNKQGQKIEVHPEDVPSAEKDGYVKESEVYRKSDGTLGYISTEEQKEAARAADFRPVSRDYINKNTGEPLKSPYQLDAEQLERGFVPLETLQASDELSKNLAHDATTSQKVAAQAMNFGANALGGIAKPITDKGLDWAYSKVMTPNERRIQEQILKDNPETTALTSIAGQIASPLNLALGGGVGTAAKVLPNIGGAAMKGATGLAQKAFGTGSVAKGVGTIGGLAATGGAMGGIGGAASGVADTLDNVENIKNIPINAVKGAAYGIGDTLAPTAVFDKNTTNVEKAASVLGLLGNLHAGFATANKAHKIKILKEAGYEDIAKAVDTDPNVAALFKDVEATGARVNKGELGSLALESHGARKIQQSEVKKTRGQLGDEFNQYLRKSKEDINDLGSQNKESMTYNKAEPMFNEAIGTSKIDPDIQNQFINKLIDNIQKNDTEGLTTQYVEDLKEFAAAPRSEAEVAAKLSNVKDTLNKIFNKDNNNATNARDLQSRMEGQIRKAIGHSLDTADSFGLNTLKQVAENNKEMAQRFSAIKRTGQGVGRDADISGMPTVSDADIQSANVKDLNSVIGDLDKLGKHPEVVTRLKDNIQKLTDVDASNLEIPAKAQEGLWNGLKALNNEKIFKTALPFSKGNKEILQFLTSLPLEAQANILKRVAADDSNFLSALSSLSVSTPSQATNAALSITKNSGIINKFFSRFDPELVKDIKLLQQAKDSNFYMPSKALPIAQTGSRQSLQTRFERELEEKKKKLKK